MLWFLMLAEAAIICELPFLSMCWSQNESQNAHETIFYVNYWFGSSNIHFIGVEFRISNFMNEIFMDLSKEEKGFESFFKQERTERT